MIEISRPFQLDIIYKLKIISHGFDMGNASDYFYCVCFYELLNNIQNRKRYPPGSKGHLHLLGKNPHKDFQNLAKTHGPLMYVRLGLAKTPCLTL